MDEKGYNVRQSFSFAAKREIVQEFLDGKWGSLVEASKAHGIRGKSTLARWIREFGFEYVLTSLPERKNSMKRKKSQVSEKDQITVLRQQVVRLNEKLSEAKSTVYDLSVKCIFLDKLCDESIKFCGRDPAEVKKKLDLLRLMQPSVPHRPAAVPPVENPRREEVPVKAEPQPEP